jgi:triosephosphate isomerase
MKFFINFKTYRQGSGKKALRLLKKIEKANGKIIACLQTGDIHLSKKTKAEVWAQHADPINYGGNTGWILPENLKENGAKGVLINHSEHKTKDIGAIARRCKELKLKTMILAPNAKEVLRAKKYRPDYIGIEPPDLIGSKTKSVASRPKLITEAVKNAGRTPLIIGAGIKDKKDILAGKKLGAKGVLIASAVTTAKNPLKILKELTDNN